MTYQKVYLQSISLSVLHIPSSQSIKWKHTVNITIKAHNVKAEYPKTCPQVFQEFGKIRKIASGAFMMNYIFDKTEGMQ